MSSAEALRKTLAPHAASLVRLARASIRAGLTTGRPLAVAPDDHHPDLRRKAASFVTLHIDSELRGCIGSLDAGAALVEDVARNAFLAAFEDPRFEPLAVHEAPRLDVEISVLGTPEPLPFASEAELCDILRPGVDGLIVEASGRRGVFLPQVWESLPEPDDFLAHLKAKVGLGNVPLGTGTRAQRFSVVTLAEPAAAPT
jgi:hypothetical protein